MPWFRWLLWAGTIILMIVLGMKARHLRRAQVATVEAFEFANKQKATEIVQSWENEKVMHTAKSSIRFDYLFLILYVLLMINYSNHQMNVEQNLVLNSLLRLNIPLAALTGFLDIIENSIMLSNIQSIDNYFPTSLIATAKFVLAGWIIVVWLVAVVKQKILR